MKIEIEDTILVEKIADRIIERLEPLLKQSSNSNNNDLMDVKGLAKYLKVKQSWVYEKIHTNQIPFQKCGRFPRFRKKQIDKWLENPYAFPQSACKPLKGKEAN